MLGFDPLFFPINGSVEEPGLKPKSKGFNSVRTCTLSYLLQKETHGKGEMAVESPGQNPCRPQAE